MENLKVKFGYKEDGKWGLILKNEISVGEYGSEESKEYLKNKVKEELEYLLSYISDYIESCEGGDWGVYEEGEEKSYNINMDVWKLWEDGVNINLIMGGLKNNDFKIEEGFNIEFEEEEDIWRVESVKDIMGNLKEFIVKYKYKEF